MLCRCKFLITKLCRITDIWWIYGWKTRLLFVLLSFDVLSFCWLCSAFGQSPQNVPQICTRYNNIKIGMKIAIFAIIEVFFWWFTMTLTLSVAFSHLKHFREVFWYPEFGLIRWLDTEAFWVVLIQSLLF